MKQKKLERINKWNYESRKKLKNPSFKMCFNILFLMGRKRLMLGMQRVTVNFLSWIFIVFRMLKRVRLVRCARRHYGGFALNKYTPAQVSRLQRLQEQVDRDRLTIAHPVESWTLPDPASGKEILNTYEKWF